MSIPDFLRGTRVCWVRDGVCVSVLAMVPGSTRTDRAEKIAREKASHAGFVAASDSFVQSKGGHIEAVGIADLRWSSDVEKSLCAAGIVQLK